MGCGLRMMPYLEICHSATIVHRILSSVLSFIASRRGGAYEVRCMMLADGALNSTHYCSRLISECIDLSLLERHGWRKETTLSKMSRPPSLQENPRTNADVVLSSCLFST
ncbi:Uncharacterized protein HZ326_22435 [Fusarium oxysporum f. sp. albedinis]|nr:Uncharacterized protein HZ326_22435 [Fusarium oxysporum f. sp. albedinis]